MATEFTIEGKEALERAKARMAKAQDDLKNNNGQVLKRIAVFLDQWNKRNFKSEGGKTGKWKAYKYGGRVVRKSKANASAGSPRRWIDTSAKLLQNTGHLRLSMLPFVRKNSSGIGSDLPYSAAHEKGVPKRNLPQRRMLPKPEEVRDDIFDMLTTFIKGVLK